MIEMCLVDERNKREELREEEAETGR